MITKEKLDDLRRVAENSQAGNEISAKFFRMQFPPFKVLELLDEIELLRNELGKYRDLNEFPVENK